MPYFSPRRWTCTTTMSQTQTATVALATTVSHRQLNLLFCILSLPPISPSFPSIFHKAALVHKLSFLLSSSITSFHHSRVISLYYLLFGLFSPSIQNDLLPVILLFVVSLLSGSDGCVWPHDSTCTHTYTLCKFTLSHHFVP